jgi:succinate dehydrogenase / fumarate reductase, membrane anchor subunit
MGAGTDLGRVRGLGAARDGVHHWWLQRVTAIANIVLMLWFVFSLVRLPALDHASVILWLRQPVAAVPMLLLIVAVFWHFRLGVQVMIEDYVQGQARLVAMLALNFYALAGGAAAIFAVLKIAFGAAA